MHCSVRYPTVVYTLVYEVMQDLYHQPYGTLMGDYPPMMRFDRKASLFILQSGRGRAESTSSKRTSAREQELLEDFDGFLPPEIQVYTSYLLWSLKYVHTAYFGLLGP